VGRKAGVLLFKPKGDAPSKVNPPAVRTATEKVERTVYTGGKKKRTSSGGGEPAGQLLSKKIKSIRDNHINQDVIS